MIEYAVKLELATTEYHKIGMRAVVSSVQYIGGKLIRVDNFDRNMSLNNGYEPNVFTLVFEDDDYHFRDLFTAGTEAYANKQVTLYYYALGALTQIAIAKITNFGMDDEHFFYIECTDQAGTIIQDALRVITDDDFPDAVEASYGQTIPIFSGSFDLAWGSPYYTTVNPNQLATAYRVDLNTSPQYLAYDYYYSATNPDVWEVYDGSTLLVEAVDYDLSYTDITFPSGQAGKRCFIDYAAGTADTLKYIGFTEASTFLSRVNQITKMWTNTNAMDLASTSHVNVAAVLMRRDIDNQDAATDTTNLMFHFTNQKSGREVLKDIADNIPGIAWRVDKNNKIEFVILDCASRTPALTLNTTDVINISKIEIDPKTVVNDATFHFQYSEQQGDYYKSCKYPQVGCDDSQTKWGIYKDDVYFKGIAKTYNTVDSVYLLEYMIAAKYYSIFHRNPEIWLDCNVELTSSTIALQTGDLIAFAHPDALSAVERLYQIYNIRPDIENNSISLRLKDIDDLKDLDSDCLLIIHCNYASGSGVNNYVSSSPYCDCSIIKLEEGLVCDADAGAIHGYSFSGDGSNDYLSVSGNNSTSIKAYWDILQYTDYTISFFASTTDLTISQIMFSVEESATKYIRANFNTTAKRIGFLVYDSANIVSMVTANNSFNDTNRHHIAICKVGTTWGYYLDGTQLAYTTHATTPSILAQLNFFYPLTTVSTQYWKGRIEEIGIWKSNIFGAAPVVGLTDTIAVPTNGYDWEGLR